MNQENDMTESAPAYAHEATCAARPIEAAVQQTRQLQQMADNIQARLFTKLGSLQHGINQVENIEAKRGSLIDTPEAPQPELIQLERNLARLERHLHEILDATNAFESL